MRNTFIIVFISLMLMIAFFSFQKKPIVEIGKNSKVESVKYREDPLSADSVNYKNCKSVKVDSKNNDPLIGVAQDIVKRIDYSEKELTKSRFKQDFIDEYKRDVRPRLNRLWEYIPEKSRTSVDLNGDGVLEYVVTSNGLNKGLDWGGEGIRVRIK